MSSTEVYIVEVYVWMESSSDEMRRLIHEFYLSCRQQEIDQVDRSSQCKRIMHQFFVELEKKIRMQHWMLMEFLIVLQISIKFNYESKSIKRYQKEWIFDAFCAMLIVLKIMNVKKNIKRGVLDDIWLLQNFSQDTEY